MVKRGLQTVSGFHGGVSFAQPLLCDSRSLRIKEWFSDLDMQSYILQLNDRPLAKGNTQFVQVQVICIHKLQAGQSIPEEAFLKIRG